MSTYSNASYMQSSVPTNVSNGMMQAQVLSPPSSQMQQQNPSAQQSVMSSALPPTTSSGVATIAPEITKILPPPVSHYPSVEGEPQLTTINGRGFQSNSLPISGSGQTQSFNLPIHMRPPMQPVLTNGGSATSSRTASPSINSSPIHMATQVHDKQQLQQQVPSQMASTYGPPKQQQQNVTTPPPTNAMNVLNNSMQNVSLNNFNGPSSVAQPPPPVISTSTNNFPTNFQTNFKTSALNTASSSSSLGSPPNVSSNVNSNTNFSNFNNQQNLGQPLTMPPSNVYKPRTHSYPNPVPQKTNTLATSTTVPPPSTKSAFDQNQFNNKQQIHQQQQQQSDKPMYPPGQMMPPPSTPVSAPPQSQAYFQAYHVQPTTLNQQQQQQQQQQLPPPQKQQQQQQQQPPPAAAFNGQQSSGLIQYPSPSRDQAHQYQYPNQPNYNPQMSVVQQGFNSLWGQDTIDLMQTRHILTAETLKRPKIVLHNQFQESINCHPDIIRCTVAKIPDSQSLLQKSRLPLGILIHPFRDVNSLPVIQCPNIVRCRLCRTYINPFVYFVDSKMWKCNLCYRVNELPDDFQFDPATKTYGDVTRRPEVRSSTIEFIAPSEYMLRPPQPAIYLFLFDVSIIAQQSGYLENACTALAEHLDDMPGDARTQIGFIAYNSEVHFYSMAEGYNQPHEMTLVDIDDPFLPRPDNLLVNLKECKELVKDLLSQLPTRYADTHDPGSALGSALQVASKLMQSTGGRVTVFQTCLPNKGPGALEPREDPNNRSAKDVAHLNPATDFYKRYALECSGFQVAIDLFLLNQQYSDLATISGVSKHSGGVVHHFPLYQKTKSQHVELFKNCFKRYLTRKIGFEAVMRIRCTRGLQVHTFHGNFFVRSTDLLSLPNVNPDAGYGMQISYEESLTDIKTVCFQAALLYTNSEGERRIRVHTLCLPVTPSLSEVMYSADTEAIVALLSKMAVDRSITSNLSDAREAFINATVDIFNAFKIAQNLPSGQGGQLVAPKNLALLPLYILAMLKHPAFRIGTSTRLDDRVFAMDSMKTLPLDQLMRYLYPEFYHIDGLFYNSKNCNETDEETDIISGAQRLQLSAEYLDSRYMFLLDCGALIIIYVGLNVPSSILESSLGVKSTVELPDYCFGLPSVDTPENDILQRFIMKLNDDKPYPPIVQIIRDTSTAKATFTEKLTDDRSESTLSYYEFLQHIRSQVK